MTLWTTQTRRKHSLLQPKCDGCRHHQHSKPPSVRKRNGALWQKDDASSVNSRDTCPETVQRNQTDRIPSPAALSPHEVPHLLLKYEPHVQTMRKQLSPCQNRKKGLTMLSIPLGISMKEKDKS
jgi:hypothetical protein